MVAALAEKNLGKAHLSPHRSAHILANAVRGFKQVATTPEGMRQLIHELLLLSFDLEVPKFFGHKSAVGKKGLRTQQSRTRER